MIALPSFSNCVYLLLLILFPLLISCGSYSRRVFILDRLPDDSIRLEPVDLKSYKEQFSEYDGVYLLREYMVEYAERRHGKNSFSFDVHEMSVLRYVVLNPDAEWLTTFRLEMEDGEELSNVYINVIAPDGSIRRFDKEDLHEERDSDGDRVYKLAYAGIVEGSIVDEGYEIFYNSEDRSEIRHDIDLGFSVPCEHLCVRYAYPASWTIRAKRLDMMKQVEYSTAYDSDNKLSIIGYDASDIPAIDDEVYSPYTKEFSEYLDVAVQKIGYGHYEAQAVVPQSWEEYAEEYREYALDRGSAQSRAIRNQVDKIVADSDSPGEKMEKIVAWVQREIDVDWEHRTSNFSSVVRTRRANPYLICGLTRAMLENVGITSSLILIHSAEEGYFDPTYFHWGAFYQAGVSAEVDGTKFYLFPWIENYPIDQVPAYFQGQPALIITPEGYGGFETIPYGSIAGSKIESSYDVEIDPEGAMHVTETRQFFGEAAYELRRTLDGLGDEQLEREIREMLSYEGGEIVLGKYEVEKLDEYSLPLTVRMTYSIDNLVTITPDEAIVRSEGLFSPASRTGHKLDTAKRRNPIRIYSDEQYVKHVSLRVPKTWRLVEIPKPIREENRFGHISATYSFSDGLLSVEHERVLQRSRGTASDIGELQALIGKRSRLNVPTLVFRVE